MLDVVLIMGGPCSGKTTLVKKTKELIGKDWESFVFDNICGEFLRVGSKTIYTLGKFDYSQPYPGTDRLPLNALPTILKFCEKLAQESRDNLLFTEGDRVTNRPFIMSTKPMLFYLSITKEKALLRLQKRGDKMAEKSFKCHFTKAERLADEFFAEKIPAEGIYLDRLPSFFLEIITR